MKLHKSESGFSAIEVLLVIIILGILGFTGYFVYHAKQNADKNLSANPSSGTAVAKRNDKGTSTEQVDQSQYLNVKEWNLRFKQPVGLSDVQYKIFNDTQNNDLILAIYAKPTNANVNYISNYQSTEDGIPNHALGIVFQSSDATKDRGDSVVNGKQIEGHYYYTAWAFNGLATGAGCTGLYGNSESDCQVESKAFQLVNQGDSALLNTIEPTQ